MAELKNVFDCASESGCAIGHNDACFLHKHTAFLASHLIECARSALLSIGAIYAPNKKDDGANEREISAAIK
jgi:hypothetical protein